MTLLTELGRSALALGIIFSAVLSGQDAISANAQAPSMKAAAVAGAESQNQVQLPDGRWLVLASDLTGESQAWVVAGDGSRMPLASRLQHRRSGSSLTVLPDGRVLITGGVDEGGAVIERAEVFDPTTQQFAAAGVAGVIARTHHTATVLTDGRLLVVGGTDRRGAPVAAAEFIDPTTGQPERLDAALRTPRSKHVSALLPNGDVLVWGGTDAAGNQVSSAELFNVKLQRFESVGAAQAQVQRQSLDGAGTPSLQTSIPAADERDVVGSRPLVLRFSKRIDVTSVNPSTVTLIGPNGAEPLRVFAIEQGQLAVAWPVRELLPSSRYTLFVNGVADPQKRRIALLGVGFDTAAKSELGASSKAAAAGALAAAAQPSAALSSLSSGLSGDAKLRVEAQVAQLSPDERLRILQAETFVGPEDWIPGREHFEGRWLAARAESPLRRLSALQAAVGETALAGQVLSMHGRPVPEVTLRIGKQEVRTDATGRFLLKGLAAGGAKLEIDGATANKAGSQYGYYAVRVQIVGSQTNVLPYTVWMPRLDPAGTFRVASPTIADTVIKSPRIPGLELHIPAGTVIRGRDGKIVTEINITAIPVDRPPFPVPDLGVPVYFTVQPGGAVLQSINSQVLRGARLYYPNFRNEVPGARGAFWNYDPAGREWYVYGLGTISPDASQAIPDPKVAIYEFTGAMFNGGNAPPPPGPPPCGAACCLPGGGPPPGGGGGGGAGSWTKPSSAGGGSCGGGGDPVDLFTGQFEHTERDLMLPDVIPIDVTRTYRALDKTSRAFGVGMTHAYDISLNSENPYQEVDIIMPGGGRVHYVRISEGTDWQSAVFESTAPGIWYKSVINRDLTRGGWRIDFRDGRQWYFPQYQPITEIRDANGNTIQIIRQDNGGAAGKVARVVSPNGRFVTFAYNGDRVSEMADHLGRKFTYTYDGSGRLIEVLDPMGGKRVYTWDTAINRITSIKDPNDKVMVQNLYESVDVTYTACSGGTQTTTFDTGRVKSQTLADNSTFTFNYAAQPVYLNCTLQLATPNAWTEVTDRRGSVRKAEFNADGYVTKSTFPVGAPEQQISSFAYTGSLMTESIDPLNRRTTYEYDSKGNRTKITRLPGTADEAITLISYDPVLSRPLIITDPNNNVTTLGYDAKGNLREIKDALLNITTMTYDPQGKLKTVTDALTNTTALTYDGADLISVVDPLNREVSYFNDEFGRVQTIVQPLGQRTYQLWDSLNRLTQVTDANGASIKFTHDANGNVRTQVDQNNRTITNTYNAIGKLETVQDALLKSDTYTYESGGQLQQKIDRKGQLSRVSYDAMGRVKRIGFGASAALPTAYKSVLELSWDNANRLTQIVDKTCATPTTSLDCASVATSSTTQRSWDNLDRLIQEVTPRGEVNYTYDKGGRRLTMAIKNGAPGAQTTQPTISYQWDAADRLTQVRQAAGAINGNTAQTITLGYNPAGWRTQTKLANGSTVNYGYDSAGQITSIAYKRASGLPIGNLSYTYDANGRRTSVDGNLARLNLPPADILDAAYDNANRLTTWGGKTFSYDDNGNLIADGANTYQWDERNQLKSISAGASTVAAFQYDSQGRRSGKTVGSTTTGFIHDGDNFVQELLGTSNTSAVKAHLLAAGIDETFLRIEGTSLTSFLPDANNNTVRLLDNSQAKVVDYTYEAYGATSADAANGNSQQYTGRENDNPGNANGLYYYRARYYMPGCMRFISEDPIGWASGQANNYSYVAGNPVLLIDPRGEFGVVGAVVGGVVGGLASYAGAKVSCSPNVLVDVAVGVVQGAIMGALPGLAGWNAGWGAWVGGGIGSISNVLSQGLGDSGGKGLNVPAVVGSAIGGAFGGAWGAAAGSSFGRGMSGAIGVSISEVGGAFMGQFPAVIGSAIGSGGNPCP